MSPETKKYLIYGTAIVVTVAIGVIVWKKYQTGSSASAAASDQSNQDQLALELAALESNAYAGQAGGAQSFSPATVGSSTPTSLADEVAALEHALGFGPPPASTVPPTTAAPTTPATPAPTNPPAPTPSDGSVHPITHQEVSDIIRYNHGGPLFELDGISSVAFDNNTVS